jgi:hypothetical protein
MINAKAEWQLVVMMKSHIDGLLAAQRVWYCMLFNQMTSTGNNQALAPG